mgnify:CR=1 FL=1
MTSRAALIVLTADDYAMTAGVSTGIRQLALVQRDVVARAMP